MTAGDEEPEVPQISEALRDRLACLEMEMRENIVDFRADLMDELDSDD